MEKFFEENFIYIAIVALIILMLILVFAVLGVNFNPNKKKYIKKIVTVETFDNKDDSEPKPQSDIASAMGRWAEESKNRKLIDYGEKLAKDITMGIEDAGKEITKRSAVTTKICNELTERNCKEHQGCVYITTASGEKRCEMGNKDGPLMPSRVPQEDYSYHHTGKCYGEICE
jgi:hypothetical protein